MMKTHFLKSFSALLAIGALSAGSAAAQQTVLQNWNGATVGTVVTFQAPTFSGTTAGVASTPASASVVIDSDLNTALDTSLTASDRAYRVTFTWAANGTQRVRLSTGAGGTLISPNPAIDLAQGLGFYAKANSGAVDIRLLVRETGGAGPIGSNGGAAGTIERSVTAATLDASVNSDWQYVYFPTLNAGTWEAFTGNGTLDGNFGVLEALWITPAGTPSNGLNGINLDGVAVDIVLADIYQGPAQTPNISNPAVFGTPSMDGTVDSIYGSPIAVQTTNTNFGNANGALLGGGGSELNALFVTNDATHLYVMATGNLEGNGNTFYAFFDMVGVTTGVNGELPEVPTAVDGLFGRCPSCPSGFVNPQTNLGISGLEMPTGFNTDFGFVYKGFDSGLGGAYGLVFSVADYAALTALPNPKPTDLNSGVTNATVPPVVVINDVAYFGTGATFKIGFDNRNAAGVDSGMTAADQAAARAVTSGFEVGIPLSALGNPAAGEEIRIIALVASGDGTFISNQVLPGLPTPGDNIGNSQAANLQTLGVTSASFTVLGSSATSSENWTLFE